MTSSDLRGLAARESGGPISHPAHYRAQTGHEAIDVIEAWGLGFNLGNVIKYVARAGHKANRLEDLEKALWYLQREVESARASK